MQKRTIQFILLGLGLLMLLLGLLTGGYSFVWNNARIICQECIGIG